MSTRVVTSLLALLLNGLLAACVAPITQLAPISPEEIEQEESTQRELVLRELAEAQNRLDSLSHPILVAARELCPNRQGARFGIAYGTKHDYERRWQPAAVAVHGVSDAVSVIRIMPGFPAQRAEIRPGDRIVAIGDQPVPAGKGGKGFIEKALTKAGNTPVRFTLIREGATLTTELAPTPICNVGTVVTAEGSINAFADGERIIFPWAMMRFARDSELTAVIAHEVAHNAMGHIDARMKNAAVGAFFGALLDIAAATQGVNTYGQNTENFMAAAATAFSQDFEREADYVGLYIMARAGLPTEGAGTLWRKFAQVNPSAIGYATTHPTTAERFVRIRNTTAEIVRKRADGAPLLPEMKKP
jgi:membrane-associated protease RseP (regulator of RpoE activity)